MLVGVPQPEASPWEPDMSALPSSEVLFQWGRARHLRPRTYFHDLAQHWQPVTKRIREAKRAPKNYLGLHWQGAQAGSRERAAYQMMKKG
jgi:hypothetical protein